MKGQDLLWVFLWGKTEHRVEKITKRATRVGFEHTGRKEHTVGEQAFVQYGPGRLVFDHPVKGRELGNIPALVGGLERTRKERRSGREVAERSRVSHHQGPLDTGKVELDGVERPAR